MKNVINTRKIVLVNMLNSKKKSLSIPGKTGTYFCTGFTYDPDHPTDVKFYRNLNNTPYPAFSGNITYLGQTINIPGLGYTPMQIIPNYNPQETSREFYDRGLNIAAGSNTGTYTQSCQYVAGNIYPQIMGLGSGKIFTQNPNYAGSAIWVTEIKSGNVDGLYTKWVTGDIVTALLALDNLIHLYIILINKSGSYQNVYDPTLNVPIYDLINDSNQKGPLWTKLNANSDPVLLGIKWLNWDYWKDGYVPLNDLDYIYNLYTPIQIIQLNNGTYGVVLAQSKYKYTRFVFLSSLISGSYTDIIPNQNLCNPCIPSSGSYNMNIYFGISGGQIVNGDNTAPILYLYIYNQTTSVISNKTFKYIICTGYGCGNINRGDVMISILNNTTLLVGVGHTNNPNVWDAGLLNGRVMPVSMSANNWTVTNAEFGNGTVPGSYFYLTTSYGKYRQLLNLSNGKYIGLTNTSLLYDGSMINPNNFISIPNNIPKHDKYDEPFGTRIFNSTDANIPGTYNNLVSGIWDKSITINFTGMSYDFVNFEIPQNAVKNNEITPITLQIKQINQIFDNNYIPTPNVSLTQDQVGILFAFQQAYVNLNLNISIFGQTNLSYDLAVKEWLTAYQNVLKMENCVSPNLSKITTTNSNQYSCNGYYNILNIYPSITDISVIWTSSNRIDWVPCSVNDATSIYSTKFYFIQIIQLSDNSYLGINVLDNQLYTCSDLSSNQWNIVINDSHKFVSISNLISGILNINAFSAILDDGNIWQSPLSVGPWTKLTNSNDCLFILATASLTGNIIINYIIKSDNNLYLLSINPTNGSISTIKALSTTKDFIHLSLQNDKTFLKIDTSNRVYSTTDTTLTSATKWTFIKIYGFKFTNIIQLTDDSYLSIGINDATTIANNVMIEANDQGAARQYGHALLQNSAKILFDKLWNMPTVQNNLITNGIESNDHSNSLSQGALLQLQINKYMIQNNFN